MTVLMLSVAINFSSHFKGLVDRSTKLMEAQYAFSRLHWQECCFCNSYIVLNGSFYVMECNSLRRVTVAVTPRQCPSTVHLNFYWKSSPSFHCNQQKSLSIEFYNNSRAVLSSHATLCCSLSNKKIIWSVTSLTLTNMMLQMTVTGRMKPLMQSN